MSNNNEIKKQKILEFKNIISSYNGLIKSCNPNAELPDIDTIYANEYGKDILFNKFGFNIYFTLLLIVNY